MKELQSYSISLNALIPRDTGSQYRSDWVAALFDPLTTKDCTILIPLSRTMGMFQANEVLADLAWSAMNKNIESDERDSFMARANLICCAFNHWKGLAVPQESILKKAKEHLVSLEVHQLMNNSEDPDLEASMVIGGMCSLGMQKEAIEIVSKGRFSQFSRDMDLSYLMILVSLCDGNISAERKSLIEEFILSKLRFTTENEAKDDVMDYLVLKGFHLDRVKHKNGKSFYVNYKNKRIRGLSMAIAKSTGNHEFRKFLVSNKKREGDVWV